jgi:hypothetical protein
MEPIMRAIAFAGTAVAVLMGAGGLGPLVKDDAGASAHLLPRGAMVPLASSNAELMSQISLNDGIDDQVLIASGGVIPRLTGMSNRMPVRYWSFGPASFAPSPLYKFYAVDGVAPLGHPSLVDALPGDPAYSGVHSLIKVVVTDKYDGQVIASSEALADAIHLGLVEDPEPTSTFVTSPIVLPETRLSVSDSDAASPEVVYGRGYAAGMFELGGDAGVQPGGSLLPVSQVSFLRVAHGASYDMAEPIFQATIQMAPPPMGTKIAKYTPLCAVLDVDLVAGTTAGITQDSDLFNRNAAGAIMSTTSVVAQFQATPTILLYPLQFKDGAP